MSETTARNNWPEQPPGIIALENRPNQTLNIQGFKTLKDRRNTDSRYEFLSYEKDVRFFLPLCELEPLALSYETLPWIYLSS